MLFIVATTYDMCGNLKHYYQLVYKEKLKDIPTLTVSFSKRIQRERKAWRNR